MQALVLAGGQGTRLRPLTSTIPKPVMPLVGRPFLSFMLAWLKRHGVDDVILSCGFLGREVRAVLGDEHDGVRLRYVTEETPLDTAGPVALAAALGLVRGRLLVLNGDVLADFDLTEQIAWHAAHRARATIAAVPVDDTSSYGVVPTSPDGQVEAFLEKSAAPAPTNLVNAGAYILEREVVAQIPIERPVSFEREVFPALIGRGLFAYPAKGYWKDIGTLDRYLEATADLIAGRVDSPLPRRGDCVVDVGSAVEGARVGPGSVVGPGCSVGRGTVLERAVLHNRVRVGRSCRIERSIVADDVTIEDGAAVDGGVIVGRGARICAGARVRSGARIRPLERVT